MSARGTSARISAISASGSRADNGWTVAPNFHAATAACTHSIEFGNMIET